MTQGEELSADDAAPHARVMVCHRWPQTAVTARTARQELRAALRHAGISGQLAADAELVLDELVANAVRHGTADVDGMIEVCWFVDPGGATISVRDSGTAADLAPGQLVSANPAGRGLALVDALSTRWWWNADDGTRVSAELLAPTRPPLYEEATAAASLSSGQEEWHAGPMTSDLRDAAMALFDGLLARTHLSRPSDVAGVVAEEARASLNATDVVVYWVNREQSALVPIATPASPHRDPQPVDGSVAGRSFATSTILTVPGSGETSVKTFVPVMDGTERVGVLELEVPADEGGGLSNGLMLILERFGHAIAMALMAKMAYGDSLELVQRSRAMDLGAELLWSVVPPLTFATDGLVISVMLEPAYENGGDAFDYAVNDDFVHVAVFDGVGHGLRAAGLSTFAIAAYRYSRRTGLGLLETFKAIDGAIADNFPDNQFVTGLVGQLDPATGLFRWVNAGHHPPLLLRSSRVVKVLESEPATPFGVPLYDSEVKIAAEHLEPGDLLVLYTDGAVEARRPDGTFLGLDGLVGFLERDAATKQTAPETLRRLQRTLLGAEGTVLNDDATVMLLEWSRGSEERLLPQTVHDRIRTPPRR